VHADDYDYHLPPARIAQTPVEPRDAARLLVDRGPDHPPDHRHVRDLPALLEPGDLLVVNDTRVLPARLPLRRSTGGAAEVLLLEPLDDGLRTWEALVRPSRRLRDGEMLLGELPEGLTAIVEVGARHGAGTRVVRLLAGEDPLGLLERAGEMPLPPYITATLPDPERYQTVYARRPASAAAPTAGLHLTPGLLDELQVAGVEVVSVELVVGLDTFQPISTDDPRQHPIHTERYRVPESTWRRVHHVRAGGGRVIAVGTTSARALESAAHRGHLEGRTDLFIHRPFEWRVVDRLLTNFHLPRTTLLLLVEAFVGPRWRSLYEEALRGSYRFLSFGDAMLLTRTT
jgi:S-adenosylmethionine:tRNA ribosyltransferase-isomerase